jgi:hypothetical protein
MSQATAADPTLEALVPRGSWRRSAVLVVLGVVLLVALWAALPRLMPTVTTDGGMASEFAAEGREVAVIDLVPEAWGGVTVRSVEDVAGAHVVGAWAYPGAVSFDSPMPEGLSSTDFLATLVQDSDRLPRTLPPGQPATLVVLWQIDSCQVASRGTGGMSVHLAGRFGLTRVEELPFGGPTPSPAGWADGTPCRL